MSTTEVKLNTIEEAITDFKNGKVVIVVDDENRENEGDFIAPAEIVTPEVINFMTKFGRGLICVALTQERCQELSLELMVSNNTDPHKTAFTVSVDLIGNGCTTGISAHDRSKTVKALIDPNTRPEDLGRPGHIFPLIAKEGGVLRRTGHTEATVDLARLCGMKPAGALVEIMNDDGTMARLPQLIEIAQELDLKIISIESLVAYRLQRETLIEETRRENRNWFGMEVEVVHFASESHQRNHAALKFGNWNESEAVPVRVQAVSSYGDFIDVLLQQHNSLNSALETIQKEGKGLLVLLENEKRNNDERDYGIGAQIIRALNVSKMKLISSSQIKRSALEGYGLEISEYITL
jgi:3,4-dihydroxy 2-butanone 4-phosphate synthase/GTP cyclohydrolase II